MAETHPEFKSVFLQPIKKTHTNVATCQNCIDLTKALETVILDPENQEAQDICFDHLALTKPAKYMANIKDADDKQKILFQFKAAQRHLKRHPHLIK